MGIINIIVRLTKLVCLNSLSRSFKVLLTVCVLGWIGQASAQALTPTINLCLDFNGHHIDRWQDLSDIDIPAFNHVGSDSNSLDTEEITDANTIMDVVSEDFSPFNVTVISEGLPSGNEGMLTSCPVDLPKGSGLRVVIGGSSSDLNEGFNAKGIAINGSFTSTDKNVPNVALVFPCCIRMNENGQSVDVSTFEAWELGNTASHEAGHAFKLSHQAEYNNNQFVQPYAPGTEDVSPIMGGYLRTNNNRIIQPERTTWTIGPTPYLADNNGDPVHADLRPAYIQDDMDIIGSQSNADLPDPIKCIGADVTKDCIVKSPNGFGYRQDDHGNYGGRATSLSRKTGATVAAEGIIEHPTDSDYFSFVVPQGANNSVPVRTWVEVKESSTNLVPLIDIRDYTDTRSLLANTNRVASVANTKLAPGEYLLRVSGHGDPGDTGQYTVKLSINGGLSIINHQLFKDRLRLTFNERIETSTFTSSDVSILHGDGSGDAFVASQIQIVPVYDTTRSYDVVFPKYNTLGGIELQVGPRIKNLRSINMDQNGDGRAAHSGDRYGVKDLVSPRVTSVQLKTDRIRIQFSEGINPATVNQQTVRLYDTVGQRISLNASIAPINDSTFELVMASYPTGGITVELDAGITDSFGNPLERTNPFNIRDDMGPRVVDSAYLYDETMPDGRVIKQSAFLVAFDTVIIPGTLNNGGVTITYIPQSTSGIRINNDTKVKLKDIVRYNSVSFQGGASELLWLINFDNIGYGTYELKINNKVTDLFRNQLDQDRDGVNGELQDVYTHRFEILPRTSSISSSLSDAYIMVGLDRWDDEWLLNHVPQEMFERKGDPGIKN